MTHRNKSLPADGRILFKVRDRTQFPFLSNFFYAPFQLDDQVWPTVEHYYQAQKSNNPDFRTKILKKRPSSSWLRRHLTPNRCYYGGAYAKFVGDSRIGDPQISKQSWFRKHPDDLHPDWDERKLHIMQKAVRAKFTQHAKLQRALLKTGTAKLEEDSNSDFFWGIGSDGSGQNHLGTILMDLRSEL